jgi:hypothetical protein
MPTPRLILTIAMLAAAVVVAHAEEPAKTDPKTGKKCVALWGMDPADNAGKQRLIFRNICGSPFQVQIMGIGKMREGRVEPGTPEKPSKLSIECKLEERCDTAKWQY